MLLGEFHDVIGKRAAVLASSILAGVAAMSVAAPAHALVLTQNTSTTITALNSIACAGGGSITEENSYYRVFDLDGGHGITQPFTVSSVTFGVEASDAGGAPTQHPVLVRLHSLSGVFTLANLTQLASQAVNVLDTDDLTLKTVPISAAIDPTAGDLVIEVFVPDAFPAPGNSFYIGSNAGGESAPSYVRAPECGLTQPATTASVGSPNMHIVLFAEGAGPLQPVQPGGSPGTGSPKKKCKKKKRKAAAAKKKKCKKKR